MSSRFTGSKPRTAAAIITAASLLLLVGGGLGLTTAANAAFIDAPVTGTPGRLVLASDPYPAEFLSLSPGAPQYWQISARLEDATEATLALELRKSGELVQHPRGLRMDVASCAQPWVAQLSGPPTCISSLDSLAVAAPANDYSLNSPTFTLSPLASGAPRYLLVTLGVEDSAAARADSTLMGLTGDMAVGLTAVAIDSAPVPPRPPGPLAATGANFTPLWSTTAIALGLLGLGAALRLTRKETTR